MATKSKLLVRSHAVRESTSPPRESIHVQHLIKSTETKNQLQNQNNNNNNSNNHGDNNMSNNKNGAVIVDQPSSYEKPDHVHQQQTSQHPPIQHHPQVHTGENQSHLHHQQSSPNSLDVSIEGVTINGDDDVVDLRGNLVDGIYIENRSIDGGGSEDSQTIMGQREASAKINGQRKLEQQSSSQSQNGGQKTKFKTMGSSSSMEGVSSGFISRGTYLTLNFVLN